MIEIHAYDCRQHPDAKYRGFTVRIVRDGHTVMQGNVFDDEPAAFVQDLADRLGVDARIVSDQNAASVAAINQPPAEPIAAGMLF